MTTGELIKELIKYGYDREVSIYVATTPIHDGTGNSWKCFSINSVDFSRPDWHVGDEVRLVI